MSDSIPALTGSISIKQLQEFGWYTRGYNEYKPKTAVVDSLKPFAADLRIIAVLGTWCSDSREHIPALMRLADDTGIKPEQIELIGVDRTKQCTHPDISPMQIEYVPTLFIFYKGKRIGTIIETPNLTLEEDILHLINTAHD